MTEVSQDMMDKYVSEEIQPLMDSLIEYAKSRGGIPPTTFYLACLSITCHALPKWVEDTPDYKNAVGFLRQTGGGVAMEFIKYRLSKEFDAEAHAAVTMGR